MTPKPQWRVPPVADLALRTWDGGCVVHHAAANDTHRLSAEAGRLLALLLEHGPLDPDTLAQALPDADVDEILPALRRIDLVEPLTA